MSDEKYCANDINYEFLKQKIQTLESELKILKEKSIHQIIFTNKPLGGVNCYGEDGFDKLNVILSKYRGKLVGFNIIDKTTTFKVTLYNDSYHEIEYKAYSSDSSTDLPMYEKLRDSATNNFIGDMTGKQINICQTIEYPARKKRITYSIYIHDETKLE